MASLFVGALGFAMAFIASYPNATSGLINFSGNVRQTYPTCSAKCSH